MLKVLNVSNHILTKEQVEDLNSKNMEVVELPDELKKSWGALTPENYVSVCDDIKRYMLNNNITVAHVSGFIPAVCYMTSNKGNDLCGYTFLYSYSQRESVESNVNGKVVKTSVFKHRGWYKYL